MMRYASRRNIALLFLCACSSTRAPSNVTIEEVWVRPVSVASAEQDAMAHETAMPMSDETDMHPMGGTSAAYATLVNTGGADVLEGVSIDAAVAEIHQTTMENSIMRMQEVGRIDIPANGRVELSPGGYHIMISGITRDLKPGDTMTMTFQFRQAGAKQVTATVREP
jgi:periplasmic copper chaperone A